MINTYNAIFRDLTDWYVSVRNQIPNDQMHMFVISSVGPHLDLLPMLSIFQAHEVTIEQIVVEATEGAVTISALIRKPSSH